MIRKIFLISTLFTSLTIFSQQQIMLDQSAYNLYLVNPAIAGTEGGSLNTYYKKYWLSMPQSPEKILLSLEIPAERKNLGLGFIVSRESAGFTQYSSFVASVGYGLQVNEKNRLLVGFSGGFQSLTNDLSNIKAESMEEFTGQPQYQRVVTPNIGLGLTWSSRNNFRIGISGENLTQSSISFREPTNNYGYGIQSLARLNLFAQHTFILKKELLKYTPTIILKSVNGTIPQSDLVNTFIIREDLLLSIGYRTGSILFLSGGMSFGNLRLIYTYQTRFSKTNLGSIHEAGITYKFPNSKSEKPKTGSQPNETDEIYEKLQEQEAKIALMNRKTDSLDKNMHQLNEELNSLKNKQVNEEDVLRSFEEMNKSLETKHSLIKESQTASMKDSVRANYQIVLGVYQLAGNAREYQKFLARTISLSTVLVQIEGQPKKYIYVCTDQNHLSIKEASAALKETIKTIKKYSVDVTKGEPWILQTIKK